MSSTDYYFVSRWRVEGACEEVADIIGDAESLPRWCPSVYLEARVIEPGDERGVGKLVFVRTKGWLPYTLRWRFRVTESRYPFGSTLQALDDFDGRGVWTFEQDGAHVNVTYDWRIRVHKPFVKAFSFLLKPLFAFNHRWAMARSEESLKLELMRRRARNEEELARVPAPPQPTFKRANSGAKK
ncbi:MAG: SRPBCC family protein [Acidobacteriota bacterium]|nr:SRPBCC family protein [Acidobacteriota bacterium]